MKAGFSICSMNPDQLRARNAAISAAQKRAWADPEIRARRSAAIRAALDDPLIRKLCGAGKRIRYDVRGPDGKFQRK